MIKFTGITFDPNFKKNTENNFNKAQKFIDSEVIRLSYPYVPWRHGDMAKSGTMGTVIGSGVVEYIAPYAKKQYYTNAGRGKEGINAANGKKGLRGSYFFERMKADHKGEVERKAKENFT